MRPIIPILCIVSALIVLRQGTCFATDGPVDDSIEMVTDYTYQVGPNDSREAYAALGLFGAKFKAVAISAKYLTHKGLLENYGKRQTEIYCLATKELAPEILESRLMDDGAAYYVRIQARVQITDLTRAEILNKKLEKAEKKFSLQEELEQPLYRKVDPALELSRAYRYLRQNSWRVAVIYLDHLEQKYSNWSEVYMAKAIGLYAMHKKKSMMTALRTACTLGHREACEDIEGLSQSFDKGVTLPGD